MRPQFDPHVAVAFQMQVGMMAVGLGRLGDFVEEVHPCHEILDDPIFANPLAVVIPCHRVVRADGTLSGYRWGLERKRQLLRRENDLKQGTFETSNKKISINPEADGPDQSRKA